MVSGNLTKLRQNLGLMRQLQINSRSMNIASAYLNQQIKNFNPETMTEDDAYEALDILKQSVKIFMRIKHWKPEST